MYTKSFFQVYLSQDRLSSFRSTDVQAYAGTTKIQSSTLLSTNEFKFDWSGVL